jgi:hypothetical protein
MASDETARSHELAADRLPAAARAQTRLAGPAGLDEVHISQSIREVEDMSTPRTAQVYITNTTDGTAAISIWHNNKDYGTESATWTAAPGQRVGPWTVHFNTGWGSFTVLDYWACEIHVTGGSTPGLYV